MLIDEEALEELREDLGEEFTPFVNRFLESARAAVQAMETAIGSGDTVAVGSEAHTLKGTASYLGAVELTGELAALQRIAESGDASRTRTGLAAVRDALATVEPELRERAG